MVRHQGRGHQRVQRVRFDRTGAQQPQVGQQPGRGVRQDRQRGVAGLRGDRLGPDGGRPGDAVPVRAVRVEAVPVRARLQQQPVPGAQAYGDGVGAAALGPQEQPCLRRPAADGPALVGVRPGRQAGPGADPQLTGPARVPQVAVQVEAEPPVGMRVRMAAGGRPGTGPVPQREADPLARVRPRRRGPGHEVHRRYAVTPRGVVHGEGDGQPGAQQAVGRDPRHVPAQQVGGEVAQVGPQERGEFVAVGACHGPWAEIEVEARGGARPGPVAGVAAGGRGLDQGGGHGELAYARPEGKAGGPRRVLGGHQHSPCADGTSDL